MSPEPLSHKKKGVGELQSTPGGETEQEAVPQVAPCAPATAGEQPEVRKQLCRGDSGPRGVLVR